MIFEGKVDMYSESVKREARMKDPMSRKAALGGEDGSVLVLALIMLVLLTLVGNSANQIASVEMQIAGNEAVYKNNFYLAEAAAMQSIQGLENTDLKASPPAWLEETPGELTDTQVRVDGNWSGSFPGGAVPLASAVDPNTRFVAVSEGIDVSSSLDLGKSRVYAYKVYGRSKVDNGQVMILVGYRKAY